MAAMNDELAEAIDRMTAIASVVNKFNETELQVRAFDTLARALFGADDRESLPPADTGGEEFIDEESLDTAAERGGQGAGSKPPVKKQAGPKRAPRKLQLSIPKDINFAPSGKESLKTYVEKKKPSSNQEKMLVAAYYLKHTLGRKVTAGDVMAVFVSLDWKKPSDPINALQVVASLKGWLDTKNMEDISITWKGETYVQDSLPKSSK